MALKILIAVLFLVWLALFLLGKGGFIHLLVISAVCVAAVEIMTAIRSRMTVNAPRPARKQGR